ncbi:MAG: vWA domain-containing protein [Verrucomicrobiales bacterium]
MIPILSALSVFALASLAEWLHVRRIRVAARLAFGPSAMPSKWTRVVPFLRAASLSAFAWGLTTMLLLNLNGADDPNAGDRNDAEATRLIFVGDLSPSMFLPDAGPDGTITRHARMQEVVDAILSRVSGNLRFGVIGFYTESLPVVMEARDPELVRNVFNGLPITYAMPAGQTDLGSAVNASLEQVADFPEGSTRLIILTDGDSTSLASINPPPASVKEVFVLGIGNTLKGSYIDGHQSRQESDTLQWVATSLRGSYENVNEKHLATDALGDLVVPLALPEQGLTLKQWAVFAMVVGALILATVPVALEFFGTDWKVRSSRTKAVAIQRKEAPSVP